MAQKIDRPDVNEYAEFHKGYMATVADETDGLSLLERQRPLIDRLGQLTRRAGGVPLRRVASGASRK